MSYDSIKANYSVLDLYNPSPTTKVDEEEDQVYFMMCKPIQNYANTPLPSASLECNGQQTYENYHLIRGSRRFGFVVDPGAAGGLGGTDTKVEYDKAKVPFCEKYSITPNNNCFSGIDGEAVKGLGTLKQDAQIGRLRVRWHGDLIGNNGSFCPFLLALPPLIQSRAFLLHGFFDTGDGILILSPNSQDNGDIHCVRVLLTDSGHYLLPTDDPQGQAVEESELASICSDALLGVADSLKQLAGSSGSSAAPCGICHSASATQRDALSGHFPQHAPESRFL